MWILWYKSVPNADKGDRVKKYENFADIICGSSLSTQIKTTSTSSSQFLQPTGFALDKLISNNQAVYGQFTFPVQRRFIVVVRRERECNFPRVKKLGFTRDRERAMHSARGREREQLYEASSRVNRS